MSALVAGGQRLVPRAQDHHVAGQGDPEGLRAALPEGDHARPHHRSGVRILEPRFRSLQLHGADARDRPGTADRHVPRQTAHQGTAHDHRGRHRRPQPRHGAPLVQGRIEPDRDRQGVPPPGRGD